MQDAVGWGLEEDSHSLGRSARKSYPKMRALQQLSCLIGNDEYRERIMKW